MSDLIDRHEAIDALMEIMDRPNHADFLYTDEICKTLNKLPFVQPEIIYCKYCKHKPSGSGANHDISFPDEVCPCQCEDYWYSWMPKDDWFCGSWERREE